MRYLIGAALWVAATTIAAGSNPPAILTVTASVSANCVVRAPLALDFGRIDPGTLANAPLDVSAGVLSIACTKGSTGVSIALDNGGHFAGAHRNLAAGGAQLVGYEIYTAPDHATAWNAIDTVAYVPVSDQPTDIAMYGRVLANQQPGPGRYADTLLAMVNF